MNWLKIYLPIYLLIYVGVAFVLPTWNVYRKTGINPVTFGKTDNAHDYIGNVMKGIIALLIIVVLMYSFQMRYEYLILIHYLEAFWAKVAGIALIHLSLIWVMIAQWQMSKSWRIGIDETNKTELVTHGLFSVSRNPIFLGLIITVVGLFLLLPNAITFTLAVITYLVIQIQIRLEEEFLERQHGQAYLYYKQKARRLI